MEFQFEDELKDNEIYLLDINKYFGTNYDVDDDKKTAKVKFNVDIEARSWGIKSISLYVTSVYFELDWTVEVEKKDEEEIKNLKNNGGKVIESYEKSIDEDTIIIEGTLIIDTNKDKEWEINSDIEMNDDTLSVSNLEINFENKKIEIS